MKRRLRISTGGVSVLRDVSNLAQVSRGFLAREPDLRCMKDA
jgi:hypothetical protein